MIALVEEVDDGGHRLEIRGQPRGKKRKVEDALMKIRISRAERSVVPRTSAAG